MNNRMMMGRIVQVKGAVVDVAFPPEQLPEIYTALEVPVDGSKLVLEVERVVGRQKVHRVNRTDGRTMAPITMPMPHPAHQTLGNFLLCRR